MGFADAIAGRLRATSVKSDLEYKIQDIMEKKLAILDRCNQISTELSETIFQTGEHSLISNSSALPGYVGAGAYIPSISVSQEAIGQSILEQQLGQLQRDEKALDLQQKKYEHELEAVKAEEESMKKIADDHAKKDFKIG